ncbi:MAG: hypothetical protein K0R92_518 [Lachnospiraceae bacterium]|jgi:hypothetical protein|nr:hypothetical protein [Lachnospiraceae bacterium]
MSNKKTIYLGMDYSNFDGGATEVNRKMALLDAQFKLSKEEIKAYGNETDQLTLKQEQLTQKINLQTQKVNLSKEAYDKAVVSGKASDKQLDNLQKAYITNQTTLQKLNNELAENKTKIDTVNKSTNTFGDSMRGMASSLGINVSPALEAVATKFDGVDASVGNAVLGIGAIISVFASCTISAANMADEVLTLSSVTGIATDELQKMQYASKFLDVEVNTMTGSITKLTRSMDDARKGSKEQEEAFKTLRIRFKETNGELRDANTVFYETIDALSKVTNETERDALAMTLMGKSAKDLNPLIEAGSKRLKELGIEAEDMGAIMSDTALEDLGKMKDSMDKLDSTVDALKNRLGLVLLPILSGVLDVIDDIPAPVLAGIVVFAALTSIVFMVAKAAQSMAVANALLSASNVTLGATGTVATVGMGPLLLILLAIAAAIALIVGGAVGIKHAMDEVKDSTSGIVDNANASVANLQNASTRTKTYAKTTTGKGYANGTDDYPGGEAWVGEAGPERIKLPRGSRIYSNAESKEMSGGDTFIFQVDTKNIKEFLQLIEIANNYRQAVRQGVAEIG